MPPSNRRMRLDDLFDHVAALRELLAGETVDIDGKAARTSGRRRWGRAVIVRQ